MAKYSTGSGGGGAGESCELCGASGVDLHTANVAGAQLEVCSDCAEHDDNAKTTSASSSDDQDKRERRKRAARNTARMHNAGKGDASHWEEGADYDDDQLPYLVDDYGQRLTEARQAEGFQLGELAEELGIDDSDLLAVEQGRATQANVGGSVIVTLEDFLDAELSESR
jgi:ribosome-binding protein aMBF1 (putative translation factor)